MRKSGIIGLWIGLALFMAAGCSKTPPVSVKLKPGPMAPAPASPVQEIKFPEILSPASPQPDAAALKPGLALRYTKNKIRHLRDMPSPVYLAQVGRDGAPLPKLDYRYTKEEKLFDTGEKQGICARIDGFLRLPKAGTYRFQVNSNDGVRIEIDGKRIIEDPDVHGDRLSPIVLVDIHAPGWYAFRTWYFQRKGSSALQLYWQAPGAEGLEIIPARAYAHAVPR